MITITNRQEPEDIQSFHSIEDVLTFINDYLVEGSADYDKTDWQDGLTSLDFELVR